MNFSITHILKAKKAERRYKYSFLNINWFKQVYVPLPEGYRRHLSGRQNVNQQDVSYIQTKSKNE